jgi:hypothetical protein
MTAVASDAYAQPRTSSHSLAIPPALAVAAFASLAAGAVHAAAIGVHNENRATVVTFTITALVQLGWAAFALMRPGRLMAWTGAAINLAAFAGWVLAKTYGIPFVKGLDVAESPQFTDTLCAVLAGVAVIAAVLAATVWSSPTSWFGPLLFGALAIGTAIVSVFGMISASNHSHSHGAAGDGHVHTAGTADGHTHAVVPPKEYDPTKPIDLGGVPGVTVAEQARAENLIATTLTYLPQFGDYHKAETLGYRSIGDGVTGIEHFVNLNYIDDGHILDATHPESLVYRPGPDGKKTLVAAMYMLGSKAKFTDVPNVGGPLTQWHIHNNLCFTGTGQVAGLTDGQGHCGPGLNTGIQAPMLHVWIEKNPCGPFAALEGIGGGQIPAGQTKLCDHAHGTGSA